MLCKMAMCCTFALPIRFLDSQALANLAEASKKSGILSALNAFLTRAQHILRMLDIGEHG